ncbi:MAG: hypothetical protein ACTSVV_18025 [Promethearchaeota archaeon]
MKLNLKNLEEKPKNKILIICAILSLVAFLIINSIMSPIESSLKGSTGYGVLEFELAWNADTIRTIFNAWGTEGMEKELFVTYIDFLYIIAYSILIFSLNLLITRQIKGKLKEFGLIISIFPFIAGIFDIIENINLILMLTNEAFIDMGSPLIASLCASIKFTLLIVAIIYFFIALLNFLIIKIRKKD